MTRERFDLETTIQMEREKRVTYRNAGFYRDAMECDRRLSRLEGELNRLLLRERLQQMAKRREN